MTHIIGSSTPSFKPNATERETIIAQDYWEQTGKWLNVSLVPARLTPYDCRPVAGLTGHRTEGAHPWTRFLTTFAMYVQFGPPLPSLLHLLAKLLRSQWAYSPSRTSVGHDVLVHTNQHRWAGHLGYSLFGPGSLTGDRLPTHFRQRRSVRNRIWSYARLIPDNGNLVLIAGRADVASYPTVHRHLGLLDPP